MAQPGFSIFAEHLVGLLQAFRRQGLENVGQLLFSLIQQGQLFLTGLFLFFQPGLKLGVGFFQLGDLA